jgi:hypothetical protein
LVPDHLEEDNARMTTEQLKELSEALSVCSAKSSVINERDELASLMEENLLADEVDVSLSYSRYSTLIRNYRIQNHLQAH